MKRTLMAVAVVAVTAAGSAHAADLGARTYTKAPIMAAPVSTWQGFYIGGNVGYGWGNASTDFVGRAGAFPESFINNAADTVLNSHSNGVIGGGQIGYNWQMGSLLTGLEADIQGSGIKGSTSTPGALTDGAAILAPLTLSSEQKISWFGTVRGRLGVTVTPDLLLYATGGLAYGQLNNSANTFLAANEQFPASVSKTQVGWTAGAGAEWMFARNWSAKVEYLYLDLGKVSATALSTLTTDAFFVVNTWHTQENIVRAGVNYHFNTW